MKYLPLFCLLVLASHSAWTKPPTKHVLIVSIGTYEAGTGWKPLSAANDVDLLRSTFIRQGVEASHIHVLQDNAATYQGIKTAIQESLIQQVKKGDIAIFHFSGHGQQIWDDNGDEPDHFDEALVPYDSPQVFEENGYQGERLLRDDELYALLLTLRQKLGKRGHVLTLLDACHSGTATRGYGTARGTDIKMAAPHQIDEAEQSSPSSDRFSLLDGATKSKLAPLISISASAANQLNYEYTHANGLSYGSLSYAFCAVLSGLDRQSSYQELFDKLQMKMAAISARQTPQIEGNTHLMVLHGDIVEILPHMKVLDFYNEQSVVINAGSLFGMYPGTRLRFDAIGTLDTTGVEPLARGIVSTDTFPLIARVDLTGPLKKDQALSCWVFVEEQNYGDLQVKLHIQLDYQSFHKRILEDLKAYPLIEIDRSDNRAQAALTVYNKGDSLFLQEKEGAILYADALTRQELSSHTREVISRILAFSKARFIRQLDMPDPYMQLTLELLPFHEEKPSRYLTQDAEYEKASHSKTVTFKEGDSFYFRISNSGKKSIYYALLYVQSDHVFYSVFPNSQLQPPIYAEDCYLRPGEVYEWTGIPMDVFPPYGNDMLKLIATEQPLNLKDILSIQTRGNTSSTLSHPFEKLLQASVRHETRGITPSIPPQSASVQSWVIQIIPD